MATLEEPSFNILWTWRISFVSASSWDDERCKSSCRSVAVIKINLFSDDEIISELPRSSRQCFVYFLVYSNIEFNKSFFAIRVS